jgi:hypothetical protein
MSCFAHYPTQPVSAVLARIEKRFPKKLRSRKQSQFALGVLPKSQQNSTIQTVSTPLVIFFYSLAAAMIALQCWNWLFLKEQWPFFLALVLIINGAFQQFILLVRTGVRDDNSHND